MTAGEWTERFWAKVDKTESCWLWSAARGSDGYGRFGIGVRTGRRMALAHRVAYELLVGPIPDGLQIDHLCRVRACVNPDHLEPVTQAENKRRGNAGHNPASHEHLRGKTHCPAGHPYDQANTYYRANGHRRCRTCVLASNAAGRQRASR